MTFPRRDILYAGVAVLAMGVAYALFRWMYYAGEAIPFAQEMVLVFLGAVATIYLTAALLNRQTELELRKEGQVLLFQQKHEVYMAAIEQVAEIVERGTHDAALVDDLRVIGHKIAVVGSAEVVRAFREVLDRLVRGFGSDHMLDTRDAGAVMEAVALLTVSMRRDMLQGADPEAEEGIRDAIVGNSAQMQALDALDAEETPAPGR